MPVTCLLKDFKYAFLLTFNVFIFCRIIISCPESLKYNQYLKNTFKKIPNLYVIQNPEDCKTIKIE